MNSFGQYNLLWLERLQLLFSELTTTTNSDQTNLPELIHRVVAHYEHYYRMKTHHAQTDVHGVFDAPWLSSLERSLLWVAGWQPLTLFHLIMSLSSSSLEARLPDIINNTADLGSMSPSRLEMTTGDMGDISVSQMERINQLQCETVEKENEITAELATCKESVRCAVPNLELFIGRPEPEIRRLLEGLKKGDMPSIFNHQEEPDMGALVGVLKKADDLRLKVFKKVVVEILTAQQAREFLVAAAELQFGWRRMGSDKDRRRHRHP